MKADGRSESEHDVGRIIVELDERGYCVIPSVVSVEKADQARTILERILADEGNELSRRKRTQRVGRIAVKHPIFLELMAHPLIVAIWRRYLDEDMICATWTANTTYPGYNRYRWHPDWPYQRLNQPWPTDRISGQTMWLLNDFSAENGGTGIIPYSHRRGHRPAPETASDWHPDAEILTGVRGSVMVMHGATWHTARPNISNAARSALLGMYIRPIYVTQEDMRAQLADLENPSELVRQLMCANQHQPGVVHPNQ
jgi:ectoine hydroxylase-related dioxygenase (phytanoyl-CoA dioxygenase family)